MTLIRLMGKTGVCTTFLDENVQSKVLDCSIKILMHREFIDVLLPWLSKIVHEAASTRLPAPKKASVKQATPIRSPNDSKLLSLDQLSNLFECLLALLKEADPASGHDNDDLMTTQELESPTYQCGRALEKHQRAEVLRIY